MHIKKIEKKNCGQNISGNKKQPVQWPFSIYHPLSQIFGLGSKRKRKQDKWFAG